MGIMRTMQTDIDRSADYRRKQAEREAKEAKGKAAADKRWRERELRRQRSDAEYHRLVVAPREAERQERLRRDEEKRQAEEREYERKRDEAWRRGVDLLTLTQGF